MDFGSLRSVVAWRLARAGVSCEGIVVHSPEAFRLVVVEDQQIVEWTKFTSVGALRRQLRSARTTRLRAGWQDLARPARQSPPSRSSSQCRGLLWIAEGPREYSMYRAVSSATSFPQNRSTMSNAMSIPADTPADETTSS